jgi:hypothetical protein
VSDHEELTERVAVDGETWEGVTGSVTDTYDCIAAAARAAPTVTG